jgi:hypothetical protein
METFKKRQKANARKEKQQIKAARRMERRNRPPATDTEFQEAVERIEGVTTEPAPDDR